MRIEPQVDALLHFAFLDQNLIGKRHFLRQFIGFCFRPNPDGLGLHRLTVWVPEDVGVLVRFVRKLGFRYEGELEYCNHPALASLGMENPAQWVASRGSRREQVHYYDGEWRDVLHLRLLASEWSIMA